MWDALKLNFCSITSSNLKNNDLISVKCCLEFYVNYIVDIHSAVQIYYNDIEFVYLFTDVGWLEGKYILVDNSKTIC